MNTKKDEEAGNIRQFYGSVLLIEKLKFGNNVERGEKFLEPWISHCGHAKVTRVRVL